ncbi:MAG: hypothetical protein U0835_23355 [Isosphaeraceae bacterium]
MRNRIGTGIGRAWFAAAVVVLLVSTTPARADGKIELPAADAATVRKAGPRGGASASAYFNIEGKNNGDDGSYASFGVVEFRAEKPAKPVAKVKGLKLLLTQSIARFSKDGPIKVALLTDAKAPDLSEGSPLKFDAAKPGGVGEQLGSTVPLGGIEFSKAETGKVDAVVLILNDASEAHICAQINAGGAIRLVVTPANDEVAATYFGPKPKDPSQRPALSVETGE